MTGATFWQPRSRRFALVASAGIFLLALNLRPGATAVGPVLAELSSALGMSATLGGVLTALPGVTFAVFGLLAVGLGHALGTSRALALGALAIAVGLLGRAAASSAPTFLALTVFAFAGMGIGNVLLPAFIKLHFPTRPAAMTGLYMVGIALGATGGSLLAVPLAQAESWRLSLGAWGLLAAVALLVWTALAWHERSTSDARLVGGPRAGGRGSLLRSPKAVALGVFFGMQSMQAYIQFGWIAQMYRDGGLAAPSAGMMASLLVACGIPAGFIMPVVVQRGRHLGAVVVLLGALLASGYLGVLLAPTTLPWLWASCLGLSGAAFPMAIALVTAQTRDHRVTSRVSGFAQSIGYSFAAVGPFAVGALRDLTGGWELPLWLLMGSAAVLVGSGLVATRPGAIDDELEMATP